MKQIVMATTALSVVLAAPVALAQETTQNQSNQKVDVVQNWNYDALYSQGLSVERMLDDGDVFGPDGGDIGSIENVVFSDNGDVLAIIAEVGGFWDLGDTHVSIPWDEVEVGQNSQGVTIPITEENATDYSMFGEGGWFSEEDYFAQDAENLQSVDDDIETGAGVFLASEFIGDYAYLDGDRSFGYVNDLIIAEGQLTGIVIDAASYYGTPGYYTYPFDPQGIGADWDPSDRRYRMPHDQAQVTELETFDYDQMSNTWD